MAEYKCIMCGETADSKKIRCCPVCGYRMFPTPYEKTQVLRDDIRRFLNEFCKIPVNCKEICFTRPESDKPKNKNKIYLESDQKRFPSFEKIFAYVISTKKTEEFLDRLQASIENTQKHVNKSFYMTYTAELEQILENLKDYSEELAKTLEAASVNQKLEELKFPEITLEYSETPDEALQPYVNETFELTELLIDKLRKFIKQNHIFGAFYKNMDSGQYKIKSQDIPLQFEKQNKTLQMILDKKYVVDILSDGFDEASEMLGMVWKSIALLTKLPVLKSAYHFKSEAFECDGKKELETALEHITAMSVSAVSEEIKSENYLSELDEKALFKLYNTIIEHDSIGYFKMDSSMLLNVGEYEEKLNALIGLDSVKTSIQKIKAYSIANKGNANLNLHMCFYGNPGTGKTEVARIIAGILHENGVLPTKKVIETDRSGLVAAYVGQTAIKTLEKVDEAMGGVLFIDEAYSLIQSDYSGDYGHEAVAALLKAMEDHRGEFCVILAGYQNKMQDMIASNPGFQSRIQFEIEFPNYARNELEKIAQLMLGNMKYSVSERAMQRMLDITDVLRKNENFANAREMRNILDQVIMCQNLRCIGTKDREIDLVDVNKYIQDAGLVLPISGDEVSKKILTAEEELDSLIGLSAVKRMIKKIKAYAKRNKNDSNFNLHMCFLGNPGTGKTEVARILSRLLYDAGVLPEAKLTETDSHGLIGKYVGETAPKTLAKINDSMGGVLFIDEAYSLADTHGENSSSAGYGDEAIAVLLKEMEDRRGRFCVVFAGYKDEMKSMLSSNPGLESRIQFAIDFPDYSREELCEIALAMLEKKKYTIDDDALALILDIMEYYRKCPNFANARTIRNILDQVIMNQNLRTEDMEDDSEIILGDVEDYISDEDIDLSDVEKKTGRIGF